MSKKAIFTVFSTISGVLIGLSLTVFSVLSATGKIEIREELPVYNTIFYNDDNTFLFSQRVVRNGYVTYNGNLPTKKSDEQYDYVFKNWDKPLINIKADTNFYAQYEAKTRDYLVSFANYDGSLLYADYVQAGDVASYFGPAPKKPATKENEYEFIGWDKAFAPVYSDTLYTAEFKEVEIKYPVYFINYDYYLLAEDLVPYNGRAVYKGSIPTRPQEGSTTYTFKGWDRELSGIVEETYIYAEYEEEIASYKVTYLNYDNTLLFEDLVIYGASSVYSGKTPVKPNSTTYKYTFIGWDGPTDNITSDVVVHALFAESKITFNIEFLNYDMSLLETTTVDIGGTAEYLGSTPQRPADEKYTYKFIGWDRKLTDVKDSFYTIALFESYLHQYEVVFKNGDVTLQTVTVEAGGEAHYSGGTPTKPDDDFYRYEFIGWNDPLTNILLDKVVHAQFEAIPLDLVGGENEDIAGDDGDGFGTGNDGSGGNVDLPPPPPGFGNGLKEVQFLNWDNVLITYDLVVPGNDAKYRESIPLPTREQDNKYTYTFSSFDKKLTNVQEGFNTYAQYTAFDGFVDKYIVTFRDDEMFGDGRLLYECVVDYGEMPSYFTTIPPVPKKAKYSGAMFAGWSAKLVPATQSYTVYAVYNGISGSFGSLEDDSKISDDSMEDNDTPVFEYFSNYSGELYFREKSFGGLKDNVWEQPNIYNLRSDNDLSPLYFTSNKLENAGLYSEQAFIKYYNPQNYSLVPMYNSGHYATTPNSDSYASQFYDVNQTVEFAHDVAYSFIPYDLSADTVDLLVNTAFSKSAYTAHEADYQAYAKSNYLTLTSEQHTFLQGFVAEHSLKATSITDMLDTVEFLRAYGTYNKNFAKYPQNSDNTLHFLAESREGICQHFASALTVIFRELNVPARYVTGYYTNAVGNGNTTIVQAKDKHAWTEIYINNIGWVVVDATPGGGDDGGNVPDEPTGNVNPFGPFDEATPNPIHIYIRPDQDSKMFDNEVMGVSLSYTGELDAGDHIVYNAQETNLGIGKYTTRAYPRIHNANGLDVSRKYAGRVKIHTFNYKITEREITIITASAVKNRDGKPLVADTFEVVGLLPEGYKVVMTITGSQSKPGSSLNYVDMTSFAIVDAAGNNMTRNFIIKWQLGVLEVR